MLVLTMLIPRRGHAERAHASGTLVLADPLLAERLGGNCCDEVGLAGPRCYVAVVQGQDTEDLTARGQQRIGADSPGTGRAHLYQGWAALEDRVVVDVIDKHGSARVQRGRTGGWLAAVDGGEVVHDIWSAVDSRPRAARQLRSATKDVLLSDDVDDAERRALLEELGIETATWRVPTSFDGPAADVMAASRRHGLEGIVAKGRASIYRAG
jgi:hypothetical protein